jgi:hypothetical protein
VLAVGDAVLHDGKHGWRNGTVKSFAASGEVVVTLEAIHLFASQGGHLKAAEITVPRSDLVKAPEPTAFKRGDWVRVAFPSEVEAVTGNVWQYGKVTCVYNRQLVDIRFDGTEECSHHITTFDVSAVSGGV